MDNEIPSRTAWFADARFGLFIHYGLYSVAARHEWVRQLEHLSDQDYQPYFDHFKADRLDARKWVQTAKAAGMRYAVLTTKHHDGFCLWDTELTDFNSVRSPASRDLVREFVDACREFDIKVGLYYSIIDWHHRDFPLDGLHPDWDPAVAAELNAERNGQVYVDYLHAQVDELQRLFEPDLLWFDFSYPGTSFVAGGKGADFWKSAELVAAIRRRNPDVVLNDRLDLPSSADFTTPEDMQPDEAPSAVWESCRTLNGSFGYAPGYGNWLDSGQVIRLLIDSVAKGGNLLLNVGPTARGEIEPRAERILAEAGRWTDLHADTIYGATASPIRPPAGCVITRNGSRTFLHVVGNWPVGHLVLTDLPGRLRFASFVHDGAEVVFFRVDDTKLRVPHEQPAGPAGATVLRLPVLRPESEVPVIELEFDPA